MRRFVIAATIMSMAMPAFAQDTSPGASRGGRHRKAEQTTTTPQNKADDKAYKSALDRLPTQQYDPWGTMRPADQKKP